MVKEKNNPNPIVGKFLTAEERETCRRVSQLDAGIASRRAHALLALDEGLTGAQTSVRVSLTLGQIQYLKTAFAQKRMMVFPREILLKQTTLAKAKPKTQKEKRMKSKAKKKDEKKKNKKKEKKKKDKKKDKKKKKNKKKN